MSRKRVLLLADFSRSGYAAHRAILEMNAAESLHVVILVVGRSARPPAAASAQRFAELMADAHVSRGAVAEVVMADDDPASAVRRELLSERFDLVVGGDNFATWRSGDEPMDWLLVDAAGQVSPWPQAKRARRRPNRSYRPIGDRKTGGMRWDQPCVALAIR